MQNIVHEIYSGGSIKVRITEDIDSLSNEDKILAIGSSRTITYQYQTQSEMLMNYFRIIDESNEQILSCIDKYIIQETQYFPIYAFSKINNKIKKIAVLKKQQLKKIEAIRSSMTEKKRIVRSSIKEVIEDQSIPQSYKQDVIIWSILENKISLNDVECYLKDYEEKKSTAYHKLLCVYDYEKYK